MSKHILVTGGCGFIGHHFLKELLEHTDWKISVLEGLNYAGDAEKLIGLDCFDAKRVKLYYHDLRAPIMDSLAKRIGKIDYLVNIASESDVERSIAYPAEVILNNVQLIVNVLEYARRALPEKIIHISTDECYGPAPHGYFFKEWDTHCPSNPYAGSKSSQEMIANTYWRTYGLPIIISTTMNNFGERQNPEKLVPKTVQRLLAGKPMAVYGKYDNLSNWITGSRTWLHARNHADGLLWILNNISPAKYPNAERMSKYNIAGDKEYTNLEIVNKIASVMDVSPSYDYVDYHSTRPGHDLRYALDGSKLFNAGWRPPLHIDECFERTVKWIVEHKEWL